MTPFFCFKIKFYKNKEMKNQIIIGTLALFSFASCGAETKTEESAANNETDKVAATLDDMCECAGEMMEIGVKMSANEDLKVAFDEKVKECEAMGESLEVGKTDVEIAEMKKEFQENCEALKNY